MTSLSASKLRAWAQSARARGLDVLSSGSLRGRIMRNTGWLTVNFACGLIIRLGSSLILTRLLDPSAYGLISTVMVLMVFVTMLSDLGIRTLVLADERGDDPDYLRLLWTMQALRGFVIAILVAIVALLWMVALDRQWLPPTSSYAHPLLPQLTLLISLTLIIAGFYSLNEFRLARHLEGGAIARMNIISTFMTTAITIALAYMFRSVWAIALGMVLGGFVRLALSHATLAGPPMAWRLNWRELGRVMAVSRWVALSSLTSVLMMQADTVLIGLGFGMETLGLYAIALTIYTAAATLVNQLNSSLGIPVIRSLMDRPQAERERAYYRYRLPIDLYCAAAGTGMVLFGPLFFKIAYDPRYEAGGLFLALLGLKLVLMPMVYSGNFLFAQLRYKLASFISILRTVIAISGMALGIWLQSVHLLAACVALAQLPEIIAYFTLRRTGIPFRMSRDGALLGLTALLAFYLLFPLGVL